MKRIAVVLGMLACLGTAKVGVPGAGGTRLVQLQGRRRVSGRDPSHRGPVRPERG